MKQAINPRPKSLPLTTGVISFIQKSGSRGGTFNVLLRSPFAFRKRGLGLIEFVPRPGGRWYKTLRMKLAFILGSLVVVTTSVGGGSISLEAKSISWSQYVASIDLMSSEDDNEFSRAIDIVTRHRDEHVENIVAAVLRPKVPDERRRKFAMMMIRGKEDILFDPCFLLLHGDRTNYSAAIGIKTFAEYKPEKFTPSRLAELRHYVAYGPRSTVIGPMIAEALSYCDGPEAIPFIETALDRWKKAKDTRDRNDMIPKYQEAITRIQNRARSLPK